MAAAVRRLRDIGIQRRILSYVAVGLIAMFAITALLGLQAIQQATDLVFAERLNTARTTAGILEADFGHVAADVAEAGPELVTAAQTGTLTAGVATLLAHVADTDSFTFDRVAGLWVLDASGRLLAAAGQPGPEFASASALATVVAAARQPGPFAVVPAVGPVDAGIAFATIVAPIGPAADPARLIIAAHTESKNSTQPFVPGGSATSLDAGDRAPVYHLEVVNADGLAVLGIGADERPGAVSLHFPVIQDLLQTRDSAAMLHEPAEGDTFEPHVLAVVPVGAWPFDLVIEQPADEALALPAQLRGQLFGFMGIAFVVVLAVAWVTTRHVVKPTQNLTRAAQRMAQGDLESPVDVTAQDEVGRLAASLEAMRRQLRAARKEIQAANRELESRVRERTTRLSRVVGKVIGAQEDERARLARELHDETAQTLGALSISLDRARDELGQAAPDALARISEAKAISSHLLRETQRLILDLRPQMLDDLGLTAALRWYAETHLRQHGLRIDLDLSEPTARLEPHLEVAVFRIAQEAMNNIVRHAHARRASLRLTFADGHAKLAVADDGQGFDADTLLAFGAPIDSIGLLGMQERVGLLGGAMHVRSLPGAGTDISIDIPIPEDA